MDDGIISMYDGIRSPWARALAVRALQLLWALPNILIGFALLPLAVLLNGGRVRFFVGAGGLDVVCYGWFGNWMRRKEWGATTVGVVMLYWFAADKWGSIVPDVSYGDPRWPFQERLLVHERRHVWQQLRFGVLFYVIYALSCVYNFFKHRSFYEAYYRCVFERDARAHSPGEEDEYAVPAAG